MFKELFLFSNLRSFLATLALVFLFLQSKYLADYNGQDNTHAMASLLPVDSPSKDIVREPVITSNIANETVVTSNQHDEQKPKRVLITTLLFGDKLVHKPRFRLFVETLRTAGENFEFLIVGDTEIPFELPPNTQHLLITWTELIDRIVDKVFHGNTTGVNEKTLKRLYNHPDKTKYYGKVNDYKPLFGYIFPERLERFDWWGHVDNDVLLGNLTKFFPQSNLTNADIISGLNSIKKFDSWGPFTLYRNTPKVNELFLLAPNRSEKLKLNDLFLDLSEWHFDEDGRNANSGQAAMASLVRNEARQMGLRTMRAYGTVMNDIPECKWHMFGNVGISEERCGECIRHKNGTLILNRRQGPVEVFLCHFQKSKKTIVDKTLNDTQLFETLLRSGNYNASYGSGYTSTFLAV